jgi:hypothetical protein
MAAPKLRAVGKDEKAIKPPVKSVTAAAADGSRRELLVAMRARIATAVQDPNTPARDLAALTRRLMEIAKDIEVLDKQATEEAGSGSVPDEAFDAEAI